MPLSRYLRYAAAMLAWSADFKSAAKAEPQSTPNSHSTIAVDCQSALQEIDRLLASQDYASALPQLLSLTPQTPRQSTQRTLALGTVYRQLQQPDEAATWLHRAQEQLATEPAADLLGLTLIELAQLHPSDSTAEFHEAWRVLQTLPQQPELAANARLSYAEARLSQGDYTTAQNAIAEALTWLEKFPTPPTPARTAAQAHALQDQGHWQLVMGNYPAALTQLQAALSLATDTVPILGDIALAQWRSGDQATAAATFQEALSEETSPYFGTIFANYAAAVLSTMDASLPSRELLDTASGIVTHLQEHPLTLSSRLSLAEAQRQVAIAQGYLGQGYETTLTACRSTLHDLTSSAEFRALPSAHPVRRHAASTRWALEALSAPAQAQPYAQEVIHATLAQMQAPPRGQSEEQRLAFLDHLDLASPVLALPAAARLEHVPALLSTFGLAMRESFTLHSLAAWQATLPQQSSLLGLFTYRRPVGSTWQTALAAVILSPGGSANVVDLDYTLASSLKLATQVLTNPTAQRTLLTSLGKKIWGPIHAALPTATRHLFVFLEGTLASLPLPFLRWQDQSLLESDRWMTFLSTPESLFHGAAEARPLRAGTWLGMDASAVPTQIAEPRAGWHFPLTLAQHRQLAQLTKVAPELAAVAAHHTEWKSISPTESTLRSALAEPNVRVWHFGGHGLSDPTVSPGQARGWSNCLVCPGVDLNLPEAENGLCFAQEIARLDLHHVDLAVLSACETGRGSSQHGEAVFDFARACHTAGVRDVFVSITPVADSVAPLLMEKFYTLVSQNLDPAEAAWKALRSVSQQTPNLPAIGSFRLVRGPTARL